MIQKICKGGILFGILTIIVALLHFTNLDAVLEDSFVKTYFADTGVLGIFLFFNFVGVSSACGVPRQILAMLGGYAFGAVFGVLWVSLGLLAGCACGFFFARFFARNYVQQRFSHRLRPIEAFLAQSPFAASMAIRCFPAGNNAITNLLGGVTSISSRAFIFGSAIGYLPQSIVFCLLGSGIEVDVLWRSVVSAVLFTLSSLFGLYLLRKYRQQLKSSAYETD